MVWLNVIEFVLVLKIVWMNAYNNYENKIQQSNNFYQYFIMQINLFNFQHFHQKHFFHHFPYNIFITYKIITQYILILIYQIYQSSSLFCAKILSKSSSREFSNLLNFSFSASNVMFPELSPEAIIDPSPLHLHLFWEFELIFTWAVGFYISFVRSNKSIEPSLLTVAKTLGFEGFQLTSYT